ncbi:Transcriptional regulator, LysR family (plasmid) [Sodalis praecaptivus]|uniref:Transcriptional regulator, LysR family n=1 Tax=Sodalis praecaptivus TaxID=1239307 RepID=W0HZQ0_9GAMM|nr:LysR family transcriptional regulator [Sodalis praecaptivus]AHF79311.1 Transcriptional regulator, LysR family [Sodalis praecaptivus]
MNTRKMDLNLLLTLEALLAEQNVTKAAKRLHLSQPAVSAQLNRLREIFNDPLFIPGRRGMTPSAKALELMIPFGHVLETIRDTVHSHEEFNPAKARLTATLAGTDYIQVAVIMPLVLTLQNIAPGVRIAVRNYDPNHLAHQLAAGLTDVVIATPDRTQTHLRVQHLFYETYVLIGRSDHPGLKNSLTMADFSKLKHIVVSPTGGGFTTPVDSVLAAAGLKRHVAMSAASFLFIPEIVATSDLVALVPRRLISKTLNQLTVVELSWLKARFDVSLFWHERNHGHAGHRWLRNLISQQNVLTESKPAITLR